MSLITTPTSNQNVIGPSVGQGLACAGLWTEERYLEHLQKEIETLEGSPARLHLSLAQSSFDAWLQEPAQTHDRQNAWISFYNKGELVAALLDLTLRARTHSTLEDVMRHLWRHSMEGRCPSGLAENAFLLTADNLESVLSSKVKMGFAAHVAAGWRPRTE